MFNGALYIADAGNHRIRKYDMTSTIITTVAGNGTAGYSGDGGSATAAQLSSPGQVTFDPIGNMYITDRGNGRIRLVDTNGVISTYAGNGAVGVGPDNVIPSQTWFGGLNGINWNAATSQLQISDGANKIRQVTYQPTTTILAVTPQVSSPGTQVAFTATVSPASATGSVSFYIDSVLVGSVLLNSGQATYTWTSAGPSRYIMATYTGDSTYVGSRIYGFANVEKLTTSTTISSAVNPSTQGQSTTFNVNVNPAAATGSVQILDGVTVLGTVTLAGGAASFSTAALTQGAHSITAVYAGDVNNNTSTSTSLQQTVKATAGLSVQANPSAALIGQTVNVTAIVNAGATGTVTFVDGGVTLASTPVTGGVASYSTTTLATGNHTILANYSGDAGYFSASASALAIVQAPSTIVVATSANPATAGQSVTFTAAVSPGAATGTVQFLDGGSLIGTATLAAGQASFAIASLTAGTHSITASYSGDATNTASTTTSSISQTIKTATVISLASTFNPAQVGITFGLNTTVTPSSATGTVQLLDGTTVLATISVTGGAANFSIGTLSLGTHALSAVYSGDANNSTATATLSQEVKQFPGLIPQAAPNPVIAGQAVTISGKVNTAATGTLTIKDGTATLATVTIANGIGSLTTSSLTPGVHSLNLIYNGDATFLGSQSPIDVTVLNATTLTVGTSVNPAAAGQGITFTASVTPATAAGTVQFFDGATSLGTVTLAGGQAALSTSTLTAGSHSITASYSGNTANAPATTATAIVQVVKAVGAVTLTTSVNPSTVGQSVAFTAVVTPSTATGTVQFKEGATVLGTATVAAGSASLALTTLAQGAHSITAVYGGDANTVGATSTTITQTVNAVAPGAPSNLVATASGSAAINLVWTASATAGATYNVYVGSSSGFTPSAANRIAAGVAGTSYSATGLTAATAYYFRVTAVNAGGESAPANQATATTAGVFACHVVYSVTSQNSTRFDGAFTIRNTGTLAATSWKLTWTWAGNQVVTQSSNATYKQTGNSVTFSSSGNGAISPGATVNGMTLRANYSGTNTAPTVFSVNGTVCQ